MKSYHANSGAGIAGLTLREHDEPKPGSREVLIRIRANSLNFRELMVLRGNYPLPVKPDVVIGADGAGEVVALGAGVSRVKVGDRVAAAMFPRWIDGPIDWEYAPQLGGSLDGMLSESTSDGASSPYAVRILTRNPDHPKVKAEFDHPNIELVQGSFTDLVKVEDAL
jgi:NADPH:quinone reductase-like Zn-dependent oxidoreductase